MVTVDFQFGTLLVGGPDVEIEPLRSWCRRDDRVGRWRAEAIDYAEIILTLHRCRIPYEDRARAFGVLALSLGESRVPRAYQSAALAAWEGVGRRGVVVLPTGAGKSLVARLAIQRTQRSALIVVPTLDLLEQWVRQLGEGFQAEIGILGGGERRLGELTVSTYDSAVLTMEFYGNRFGLLVVDECHHLPGAATQQLARLCIAPFRLGLTATPERDDGGDDLVDKLIGPICYRREIDELDDDVLSPYRAVRLELDLEPDEECLYRQQREVYTAFVRANQISFADAGGWGRFLSLCARQPGGREAFEAYLAQKRLARSCRAKFGMIWDLLRRHAGERVLVFTADNATAYEIGQRFLLPVLTHHTRLSERRAWLEAFRRGEYPVLVTSRVLNEGVDVPEASVGIVVSGSAGVREHVQRLGRILRPVAGKQAVLYELVSARTSESFVSNRRRQHRAYERPHTLPS
jgi:superfamily II DNA or RNA helicase